MNLKDLRYLVAVDEHRHFGRAAQACFVSQPTLSGQIKKLEEQLGVEVFERTNKSVSVTAVGESILRHARLALEQADAIDQVARAHRDPLAGPIRVGIIPTLSPYLVPLIIRPLRERHPRLRLVLSEDLTDRLLSDLRAHHIDAALVATPTDGNDVVETALFDEPFWLAHPVDHPLYTAAEVTRRDVTKLELLLLADGHCLTEQVRELCAGPRGRGARENEDLRAASLETLLQLVGAGFGCTLVPALAIRGPWTTDLGVVAKPIDDRRASRRVAMVHRASFPRRAAIEALARVIVGTLPNTVEAAAPA